MSNPQLLTGHHYSKKTGKENFFNKNALTNLFLNKNLSQEITVLISFSLYEILYSSHTRPFQNSLPRDLLSMNTRKLNSQFTPTDKLSTTTSKLNNQSTSTDQRFSLALRRQKIKVKYHTGFFVLSCSENTSICVCW